jgi:hypothetical protein
MSGKLTDAVIYSVRIPPLLSPGRSGHSLARSPSLPPLHFDISYSIDALLCENPKCNPARFPKLEYRITGSGSSVKIFPRCPVNRQIAIAAPEMGLESIGDHCPLSGVIPDLRFVLARLLEEKNSHTQNAHQRSGAADLRRYIFCSSLFSSYLFLSRPLQ